MSRLTDIEKLARDEARELANTRRRVNRARNKAGVTCPASRHVHMIADALAAPGPVNFDLPYEQDHMAGSLYSVLESLWKLRAKEKRA